MQQEEYPILDPKEIKMFAVWRWKSEEVNYIIHAVKSKLHNL
jgi:hypothetical protein